MNGTPAVRRRLVGAALRRHREQVGFALEEAARVLDCDRSKISRIETDQRGIRAKELRELLAEYGVGKAEQKMLAAITDVRTARRGWWQDYAGIVPDAWLDYLAMESLASTILVYDGQRVPDLLQTRDYEQAVAVAGPGSPEPATTELLTELSTTRQRVIMGEQRTELSVIIGEGALRQWADETEMMREQLRWLATVSGKCGWVRVQVMPSGSRCPGSGSGPVTILRFGTAPGLGVVHLPVLGGGVCLVDQADVAGHVQAFARLQASALPPDQSIRMFREIAAC